MNLSEKGTGIKQVQPGCAVRDESSTTSTTTASGIYAAKFGEGLVSAKGRKSKITFPKQIIRPR